MLEITCCPLQWWQLNNSTRGPSEKINTHQIAKMWMQFVGKVDLMWVCAGCQHGVTSQGGLKHVAAPIPRVRLVPSWSYRPCFPRASNKSACELNLALDCRTSSALKWTLVWLLSHLTLNSKFPSSEGDILQGDSSPRVSPQVPTLRTGPFCAPHSISC